MDKTRILFIHHAAGWGGAPISMIHLIENLNTELFDIQVLLLKDSIVREKLQEKGISYSIAQSTFYKKYYKYISHSDAGFTKFFQFRKIIFNFTTWFLSKHYFASKELKGLNFDIIHLNSSVLTDWLKPAGRHAKVVYHIREPLSRGYFGLRYHFFRKEAKKFADSIIAISKDNATRIDLAEKTTVVYNFSTDVVIEPDHRSYQRKIFLYVGGTAYIKGFYTLVDALKYIDADITIQLIGYYPNLKDLGFVKNTLKRIVYPASYKAAEAMKIIDKYPNVQIVGSVSSIVAYLDSSSVLLSPFSKPHFSRPIIESYVHSKPVIATNVKGMEEIVLNGKTGIIIEKDCPKSLAKAINDLASNPDQICTMGTNGRLFAIENFLPGPNIAKVEKIYKDLAAK